MHSPGLKTIFTEALVRQSGPERTAYLDEACAQDPTLRQRVEALLRSHEAAGDFLGKPAIRCAAEELAGTAWADETQGEATVDDGDREPLGFLAASDKPGSLGRLGHYEVLEVIGRGGMGIVLRAFDGKLNPVVAIKVMATPLATNATARKRFTREARAAAVVTHVHIVTIHAVDSVRVRLLPPATSRPQRAGPGTPGVARGAEFPGPPVPDRPRHAISLQRAAVRESNPASPGRPDPAARSPRIRPRLRRRSARDRRTAPRFAPGS